MATSLLLSSTLPRLIVIKSSSSSGGKGAYYTDDGSVLAGEDSVFSTLVKIEAEQSKISPNYVHLRFCYSNKYWQRKENDRIIVAVSNQPDEDTTKSSCTLFEPNVDAYGLFYFIHVQSGGRVLVDESTLAFYVQESSSHSGNLNIVNWDSLVKLPENVAFKGYNGSWLGGIWSLGVPYLQFSVDEPNTPITTYKFQLVPDGHVRIYSNYFNKYCRRSDYDWVVGDSSDASFDDLDTLFWPTQIDQKTSTIALRNAGNNKFCICHDAYDKTRCLNAGNPDTTNEAHIVVQELVSKRKIYNVRYRLEDSRIYKETPIVAGTTTAYNYADKEASIAVQVAYEVEKSQSFTRGLTLSAGVTAKFEGGVPFIVDASIEVNAEIIGSFEWNDTKSVKITSTATGTVPVPPRSLAKVHYVATKGSCDVPFSYTQEDTSSTDGTIIVSDLIDGTFTGVNAYNFSFVVDKTEPL